MANGSERNRLGGRLARYARVGTTVGGLAAQAAVGRVLGRPLDDARMAADLRAALGGLKGPVMKIAQILSTIPDAVPPAWAAELSQLQADAPPMGWPFVRRRMASELGPDWRARFADFEQTAAHAASLGQVHRATLPDGRRVAVKLQYPDMASAVEADLRQLDLLFGVYRRIDSSIDTAEIGEELGARLREELDYAREAKHIALYRAMLGGEADVALPEVVGDLSTTRLLTMTWLDGRPLLAFRDAPLDVRNRIAETLFRAWYRPLYRYGIIHGDPHLGNYAVRGEGEGLNLLDFGCVRVFPPRFIGGTVDLFRALQANDIDATVAAYEKWGFTGLSRDLIETLNVWASFLYGPLLDDRVRLIDASGRPGDYGRETAMAVHARLREQGTVRIPREFVFMDRAAVGLGGVFIHLRAELNWSALFRDLVADFDEAALARRQADVLAGAGLTADAAADPFHA